MMAGELALPVPPGFTLTTRACRHYLERGWTAQHDEALRDGVLGIEAAAGCGFGDVRRPLLLSVRSGAPESMPGMLDSVLNLGLNDVTQAGLAIPDAAFARDCRQRLEESFSASVGEGPPEDLWLQLRTAVEAVFRSAGAARAAAYRRREGLPEDWVTAVNVQAMVFGNRDEASATGVLFSRDPATGEARLYGDVLFRAQGEDVVSGRRGTEPIESLETRLPEAAAELREAVGRLEYRLRDLCEIEFTIESARLWLLQVRVGKRSPRAGLRIAAELAADPDFPLDRREAVERVMHWLADPPSIVSTFEPEMSEPLARGLGASPGVASGEVAVDSETALQRGAEGRSVILVRRETSPADVEGMSRARGLLTSRGGLASHAAVIARGWGIPAVVGLEELSIDARGIVLGGRRIGVGETISLDGASGAVYEGIIRVRERPAPEATKLLEWAHELAIEIPAKDTSGVSSNAESSLGEAEAEAEADVVSPDCARGEVVSVEAILRSLSIRGASTPEALGSALCATPAAIAASLEALESAGQVGPGRPLGVGLTEAGRQRAAQLFAADRQTLGVAAAVQALEAFEPLDQRLKLAVSDWQMRSIAGEVVLNDHRDAAWDAGVFGRLAEIRAEIGPWLTTLAKDLPRLLVYSQRLASALEAARSGDGRFVASPRVDSVHGIWFELHEDLIRLAERTRAAEVAAGRAG